MYLDVYVLSGIAIVIFMCIMMGYIGWYAYRQIQLDQGEADRQERVNSRE
jgi:Na+/proline symporter